MKKMVTLDEWLKYQFLPILITDNDNKPICWTLAEQKDLALDYIKKLGKSDLKVHENIPFPWFGDVFLLSALTSQLAQKAQTPQKGSRLSPGRFGSQLPLSRSIRNADEDEDEEDEDEDEEDEDEDDKKEDEDEKDDLDDVKTG